MKLLDLVCSTCNHRDEYLLDSEEASLVSCTQPLAGLSCSSCSSESLLLPKDEIVMNPRHGTNFSWQAWRQGQ